MAGLVRMPWRSFSVALASGSVPMGFAFAWIGHEGRSDPTLALVLSVTVPAGLWLVARRWLRAMERGAAGR
jgi:uncharacterized membrane protein YdjX (TVP38/TMEM64 family)